MTNEIQRYLVPAQGPDIEPIRDALRLLDELSRELRKDAILLIPKKDTLSKPTVEAALGPRISRALLKGESVTLPSGQTLGLRTQQTFRDEWTSGIIVAVYVTKKMLDQIDSARDAAAVIVVPWKMEHVREWRRTWNPQVLGEPSPAPEVLIENPVVEEALEDLGDLVSFSKTLSDLDDEHAAAQLFSDLYEHREPYDPSAIRAWAIRRGWPPEGADRLRNIAQATVDGKRIRRGRYRIWRSDIIEMWRERAKGQQPPSSAAG